MSGNIERVLVTGGAGFIGSHLVDRLIDRGAHVICLDNLLTGAMGNVAHLARHPRFEFLQRDVCEPLDLQVDAIYNLACPASPVQYQRDPVRTTKTAVLGALNMLELARRNTCPILQASTSEVYGDPLVHPQDESYSGNVNCTGPRSCYDEGKRCAETLFFDYRRQYGLAVKVARIFNTYGPRMQRDDGRVVSNFITQALVGAPIQLYGNGSQTRSFCYVDDLVEGLLRLMATPEEFTGPVNLGNAAEISISALAERVLSLTGSASPLQNSPLPTDDPRRRMPNLALAEQALGWRAAMPLDKGLMHTIDYFSRQPVA
ncbi:UDP-glucuronate decarboxylase [Sphingomonas kyeonggiensis]|uniref:UDP-glucuronate decarboxylase n=1 Tax=Sphingomonas kyeonggiensis TaxID=1268553 RepID=A0A7W7K1K9_9SPHN|nr:UDP-glucuronic acid decarboxylase family protein [Sphingomonas kyeonggiensis]MBB4838740.1 UDP-glucuronate decarboxylase [Sphingomonas kyeonggiensis]